MKLDEAKCEALFKHLTQESATLPLAMLIADLTEMKTVEHELRTPGSMQEISHALAAFCAEVPVYGIAELAHCTEMEEAWKVLNQCVHDVLKYNAYKIEDEQQSKEWGICGSGKIQADLRSARGGADHQDWVARTRSAVAR